MQSLYDYDSMQHATFSNSNVSTLETKFRITFSRLGIGMMQHNTPICGPVYPCQDLLGERITCPRFGTCHTDKLASHRSPIQCHNNHIICCHYLSPLFKLNAYLKFPFKYAEIIPIFKAISA